MPDLYTIFADEQRGLSIEHHFSRLEHDFVRVRKLVEVSSCGDLKDVAALYGFVAAMIARPPQKIVFTTQQWSDIVARARAVRIDPKIKPIPRICNDRARGITLDEAQRMADDPMGTWFPHSLNAHIKGLTERFGCDILINGSPDPFLTSDNPAVIYWPPCDPKPSGRMRHARGLGSPGCEITMALSPTHALLFTHKPPGVHDWRVLDWQGVFNINFRTITRAHTTIVSDRENLSFVKAVLDLISQQESAKAAR